MNKGISLFEIVIIAVSLGVVAVIAIPKLIDLSCNQKIVTLKRYSNALNSANVKNYIARKENANNGISIKNCRDLLKALLEKPPIGYHIVAKDIKSEETVTCLLHGPESMTAMFEVTGIS